MLVKVLEQENMGRVAHLRCAQCYMTKCLVQVDGNEYEVEDIQLFVPLSEVERFEVVLGAQDWFRPADMYIATIPDGGGTTSVPLERSGYFLKTAVGAQ